jgi:hypothetical protein
MRATSPLLSLAAFATSAVTALTALAFAPGCGGNVDFTVPDATPGDGATDGQGLDAAGCPSGAPGLGATCSTEGLQCQYPSGCPTPTLAKCAGGKWSVAIPDCPVPVPVCPATLPTMNTDCPRVGLECAYGDDPRPQCRQHATCSGMGWQLPIGGCPPLPTTTCPATAADAANKSCNTEGAYCSYPSGVVCGCGGCLGGPCSTNKTWHCDAPPANAACPRTLPNLGTACTTPSLDCMYGSCSAGDIADRKCEGGVWIDQPTACPA